MISVIVPIYNVAPYLDRCIQSICAQTYQNLEIILVNDGSTDASPAICEKYGEKDKRIQVLHKENGGLVSARQIGLKAANGAFVCMDIASAEMTKYAANSMLATKISFMNEISNICERVGADVNKVRLGIGSDHRIGFSFIYPGCGYGGSYFPKDVQALIRTAEEYGYEPDLLQSVEDVNNRQKKVLAEKVERHFGEDLSDRTFAVWGLTFKPDTDDMRESPAITVVDMLMQAGAAINAYDPQAAKSTCDFYLKGHEKIRYCDSKYEALKSADALILITEWKEFRSPDFYEIKKHLKTPVIFDGRNQYDKKRMKKYGFIYYQIGVCEEMEGA